MKKLTRRETGNAWSRYGSSEYKTKVTERLAEYEDTGYTPDQVIELRKLLRDNEEITSVISALADRISAENIELKRKLAELTQEVNADAEGLPEED